MYLRKSAIAAAGLVLALGVPTEARAQVGIGARASTLGVGVELSYRLSKGIGVRIGGNLFELSKDAAIENIDYRITPHLENGTAIVDLFPVGGAFHLSGGFLLNNNRVKMVARVNQNIDIGGTTYTPQQVGSLIGTLSFRKIAPYFGLGFGGRGRFAVLFDLGVGITGTPRIGLVGNTSLTGTSKADFDANVAEELAQVRSEIDGKSYLKFHPVLSLGFRFGL